MNRTETCGINDTQRARGFALRSAIISRLRRERDSVAHERLSLLSAQLKEGAPARYIARQVEIIGGRK